MDSEYEKIQLNKITHSVRASQAVLQYGVGAMVDFPEQTLMTAAPETWEGNVVEIHDERLEKVLHVDFFGMPGSKDDGRYQSGIAYARFPEWYFCPRCRSFKPLKDWIQEYNASPKCKKLNANDPYMVKNLKCPSCFQELVVARIIVACGHGHIDDFPWIKWVHAKNLFGTKKICENPRLRFTTSASSTEGLEGLTITCENCHAKKIVFHRLLKEQEGLLNYLVEQKSAVINGAAGTGKTMIAVEKATRHAVNGERVLFLCYNVMLRDYLDSEYHHEMIDYMTIDKFACKIGKTEEPNYQITEERVLDMYISGAFPYRHVIVDEGQDFGREEIEEANLLQTIHDAVIDNDEVEGTFYVFYDRLQLIQASRIPKYISEADCKLTLYKNCRNTENIAITSLKPISQRTPKLYDGAIKGVPARIHFREDSQEAIERIETLIDELKNEGITDVVILTCKSEFKSILKENSDNGTFKKKVFTTCRKFKGLEADAIILIDVDEDTFGSEAVQRFYVGASRARLRLEIVTTMTDENCEKVLREVVDYKKKIKNAKRELALAFNAMPIIE